MTLHPSLSLSFDGQCEDAFKFYERCLNGKITFKLTWGDSPMAKDAPQYWHEKILHATLILGGMTFSGGDALPGTYESPRGFGVMLSLKEIENAEPLFHALAENGTVHVPLQETFWALRFGSVTDRFGIRWEINCEKPES
jgi:PhnB protein